MKLERIIKKFALITGISLMTILPLSRCEREDALIHQPTHFSNISATQIAKGLNTPSGLASGSYSQFAKGSQEEKLIVLAEGPVFYFYRSGERNLDKSVGPMIYQISGTVNDLSLNSTPLKSFNIKDYPLEFISPLNYAIDNSSNPAFKSVGLVLDNLVMQDGSILFSSNSSDKIFTTNPIGIYLQNKELERITDMIQGTNGKIYAPEAPSIRDSLVYIPKRVISIDALKNINIEFELSSENSRQWKYKAPYFEQLKIVENSKLGKEKFGTEFYVSDMLEDVIYKIDAKRNVSELARGLRFPSSIAVDSVGDVIYTTSPLRATTDGNYIEYLPSLCMLNPETKESTTIYIFKNENNEDNLFFGAVSLYINYNGKKYELAGGSNISSILYETENKIDFLFTNSNQGTLMKLTANKY